VSAPARDPQLQSQLVSQQVRHRQSARRQRGGVRNECSDHLRSSVVDGRTSRCSMSRLREHGTSQGEVVEKHRKRCGPLGTRPRRLAARARPEGRRCGRSDIRSGHASPPTDRRRVHVEASRTMTTTVPAGSEPRRHLPRRGEMRCSRAYCQPCGGQSDLRPRRNPWPTNRLGNICPRKRASLSRRSAQRRAPRHRPGTRPRSSRLARRAEERAFQSRPRFTGGRRQKMMIRTMIRTIRVPIPIYIRLTS
jgi:hypothetical protein